MKKKFLISFRVELERCCENMLREASEYGLSVDTASRAYARWMGMLDIAETIGILEFAEYEQLSAVVFQIRIEAIALATC